MRVGDRVVYTAPKVGQLGFGWSAVVSEVGVGSTNGFVKVRDILGSDPPTDLRARSGWWVSDAFDEES